MTKEINIVNLHRALEITSLKLMALELMQKAMDQEYQKFPDLLIRDSQKLVKKINEMDDIAI